MAVSQATQADPVPPQLVPLGPGEGHLRHSYEDGRLRVGPFLVPNIPFLLGAPCPNCGGTTFHEEGDFRCLMCARSLVVAELTERGRIVRMALPSSTPPTLVRVGVGQNRWTHRRLSRVEGQTGLCARILKLVPRAPEYVVVETIAIGLPAPRDDVRSALAELETLGLVTSFVFASGYRTGYRRCEVTS